MQEPPAVRKLERRAKVHGSWGCRTGPAQRGVVPWMTLIEQAGEEIAKREKVRQHGVLLRCQHGDGADFGRRGLKFGVEAIVVDGGRHQDQSADVRAGVLYGG